MNQPTTKQELLDAIEQSHQDMMRLLASMSDHEKIIAIRDNDWSVKDSLAHIVAWGKMTLDWLTRSLQGEYVKRFIAGFIHETEEQREPVMDALNQHLYAQNKNRALADVMQDFRATHRAIFEFVAQMDERAIFDPDRFAWRNGSPAFDMIGGNTYEHYAEHRDWILEWRANPQMSYPKTKDELLRRIHARHEEMSTLLASLTFAQMLAPELDDGWSVKDFLAHLAAWQKMLVDWVSKYERGQEVIRWAPGFEIEGDNQQEQMDRYNAHLYEINKARWLDDVLDDFRTTFARVTATVEGLSADEIFDVNHFPARNGRPLITLIAGDTYEHYDEHLGWIRAWLAQDI